MKLAPFMVNVRKEAYWLLATIEVELNFNATV